MIRIGNKYIYEHIWIWQTHKGEIPKGFIIHHINHDKGDNRINNLACMSQSEHMKLHQRERKEVIPG